ncbi:MAG: VapE domain-containing protein [Nostoc sp. DedVER02]|uniref:VapE domain-containing protein n=1 Tax=unclassified Nostoc TaxID=2593658 RepID=UPI002AD3BC1C|nr:MULTISPECIES: VapE domain-containing protein [unclassified Nostoc]MDZ7984430.1 VapE family protein [Nostoc sp. DedVER02]MDZ8110761.1 VapE family protein [Nostoc sp. DedVER01b]
MTKKVYHVYRLSASKQEGDWAEATKANPCPLCGKPDWCSVAASGDAVLCRRTDTTPNGWKHIKDSKDGYPIYVKTGAVSDYAQNHRQRFQLMPPKTEPSPKPLITGNIRLATLKLPIESAFLMTDTEKERFILYPYSRDGEGTHGWKQWVERTEKKDSSKPKGYTKKVYPRYMQDDEWPTFGKGNDPWPPYRIDEVRQYGKGRWILGVEGETCVEAAREQLGLVAFTFQGGSWGKTDLVNGIEMFQKAEIAGIIYIPDNDEPGRKKAAALEAAAASVKIPFIEVLPTALWQNCPAKGDIADWVEWGMAQGFSREDFIERLEWQIESTIESSLERISPARSKSKQMLNLITAEWGHRLRFNTMTIRPELDGEPLDMDTLAINLIDEFDIDISSEKAAQIVLSLAKKRSYSPVQEYLERVAQHYSSVDLGILDDLATRYFGSNEPLHNVFMRKHLIGQVKRVFEPGCQHDTAVVLQGNQGIRKSTFWRTLAVNSDWFDDTIASGNNDKDERLKLRRFWILELAELESVFKRKEIASLRGFLTTKDDNLRVPYGRSIESFPRTSCFVGSVNPAQFLVDPEGHRRYWIIPVTVDEIPVEKLAEERDRLWAAAVIAYRNGEENCLTKSDEKRNALLNKRHEVGDTWDEAIDAFLEFQSETTVSDILSNCLKIELGKHDRILQMRVAECLKRIGWVKCEKKKISGKVLQMWRWQPEEGKVATESENRSNSDTASNTATDINELSSKVATKVVTASNPDTASNTAEKLLPLPPFSEISDSEEKKIKEIAHKNQNHKVDDSKNVVPIDTFEIGDQVEYIGAVRPSLRGKKLVVSQIEGDVFWLEQPGYKCPVISATAAELRRR